MNGEKSELRVETFVGLDEVVCRVRLVLFWRAWGSRAVLAAPTALRGSLVQHVEGAHWGGDAYSCAWGVRWGSWVYVQLLGACGGGVGLG